MNIPYAPSVVSVSRSTGLDIPVPTEELFLKTVMMLGGPPQRPGLDRFSADPEHAVYFYKVVDFWKTQKVTGDNFAFMAFYNTKYVPWLNFNEARRRDETLG